MKWHNLTRFNFAWRNSIWYKVRAINVTISHIGYAFVCVALEINYKIRSSFQIKVNSEQLLTKKKKQKETHFYGSRSITSLGKSNRILEASVVQSECIARLVLPQFPECELTSMCMRRASRERNYGDKYFWIWKKLSVSWFELIKFESILLWNSVSDFFFFFLLLATPIWEWLIFYMYFYWKLGRTRHSYRSTWTCYFIWTHMNTLCDWRSTGLAVNGHDFEKKKDFDPLPLNRCLPLRTKNKFKSTWKHMDFSCYFIHNAHRTLSHV